MTETEFKRRTKAFAIRVIRLVDALPSRRSTEVIGKQLLRSATSVAANYRSACRGKSRADFAAKLAIVEEEADESLFGMELLVDAELLPRYRLAPLMKEVNELVAMTVSSIRTLRLRK